MPRSFFRPHLIFWLIGIWATAAFRLVDDDFSQRLIEQFRAYARSHPTEKVYLHTDRDAYLTSETIWMKGYVMDGNTHTVDTISRVLYVELIDPAARRIALRAQLRATNGYAPGQLTLPDSLPAGSYQLRAYTNFMRNYAEAYYFTRTITVLPSDGTLPAPAGLPADQDRPDIQFLPEGGQLIGGLDGRVAFKAIDQAGRSVSVEGFVLNAQNDTLTGFSSSHRGMGYFAFRPEASQRYTAYVRRANGKAIPYDLPKALTQGVVLQVDNLSNRDNIRVYIRHNKTSSDATAQFVLLAQTRGQLIQMATIPLSKKTALVSLPRAQFPEGIAQLTLFDETHQPVCERLVFVDKNDRINVRLTPVKTTYANREQVDVTVSTTDATGKPTPANLSLSAVDTRLAIETDSGASTIAAHLLLASDLTGPIEQAETYFDPANANRAQQLDMLMMTQGWRRFMWADVLGGAGGPPIQYAVERGLSLTGQVLRSNRREVGEPVKLTFVLAERDSTGQASQRQILAGDTDERGRYGAYDLDFTDTTTVLIQAVKGKANRDLVVTLDQLLTPKVTVTRIPYNPLLFRRDELGDFLKRATDYLAIEQQIRRNREVLLQAVTVRARKIKEQDSRKIYGTPDATVKFTPQNTAGRFTILDVIQGQIAGVQVTGTGFNASVQIRGATNFSGPVEPLFVVDGMPMDKQGVFSLSVQDVDQVDVLKGASAAIYGSRGGGGVISILTKRGSPNYDLSKEAAPGSLLAKLPGYTPVRMFYTPRYPAAKAEDRRPDYRTTLFWTPLVQTNAEGKATVSFFTSDAKTTVKLRAEGITALGQPGAGQATIRVD